MRAVSNLLGDQFKGHTNDLRSDHDFFKKSHTEGFAKSSHISPEASYNIANSGVRLYQLKLSHVIYRTLTKEGPWVVHLTLGQDWGMGQYSRYQYRVYM